MFTVSSSFCSANELTGFNRGGQVEDIDSFMSPLKVRSPYSCTQARWRIVTAAVSYVEMSPRLSAVTVLTAAVPMENPYCSCRLPPSGLSVHVRMISRLSRVKGGASPPLKV